MRLEPFGDTHLEALTGMLGDPEILRFTRVPEPTPPDFARAWLESYEAGRRDGTREAFAALNAGGRQTAALRDGVRDRGGSRPLTFARA